MLNCLESTFKSQLSAKLKPKWSFSAVARHLNAHKYIQPHSRVYSSFPYGFLPELCFFLPLHADLNELTASKCKFNRFSGIPSY